jgi:SAM-dependent methyltransferase
MTLVERAAGSPAALSADPDTLDAPEGAAATGLFEAPDALFGAGGSEPYARALHRSEQAPLMLRESGTGHRTNQITMDVDLWSAEANATDIALLDAVTGPVLDIGCGPGRMVRAALDLGLDVLGIDVSPAAIEVARAHGLPVALGSVFEAVPRQGQWQTVLLVDGNIGIGGDVAAMLSRCRELITPTGEIVLELHTDATTDRSYTATLVDADGGSSAQFPWAEIGLDRIEQLAPQLRLSLMRVWTSEGRSFCLLGAVAS